MSDVSTIIRIHTVGCLPYLKRALFSLTAQTTDVYPIIVMQRFQESDQRYIERQCNLYCMGAIKNITYVNVSDGHQKDIRSRLLNVGVSKAHTRFLHFLDFDDVMYADAYNKLINVLTKSQAAIAFGAITSCYFENVGGHPYIRQKKREYFGLSKYDLFVDNFCPLHSFLIDLSKVDKSTIVFDEEMTALEDYNFLLDFLSKHEADFSEINYVIGEYFKRDGDTITAADNEYPDPSLKLSRLQKARETILIKKRSTKCEVRLSEFSWLTGRSLPATLKEDNSVARRGSNLLLNSKEFSPALHQLQIRTLLDVCEATFDVVEGDGYIDFIKQSKSQTIIGGWLNDFCFSNMAITIFAIHRSTYQLLEAVRMDREDVRAHLSSEYKNFGFEFAVAESIDEPKIGDWCIMMYSHDDGILRKIPLSDNFNVAG